MLTLPTEHPKPQYWKIDKDAKYNVAYNLHWVSSEPNTCPLRINLYRVKKDYALETLHSHVTVYVGKLVKLDKRFVFPLLKGERICAGATNMSPVDFTIERFTLHIEEVS